MIKYASLAFVALSAGLAYPAAAQNDQVEQGPPPAWANTSDLLPVPDNATGLAFMRGQDIEVHLDASGQKTFVAQRIKLLHPQALQLGNVAIEWNPASGAPVVHALKIYRGETVVDVLAKSKFEVLRREDQLEAAKLDGMLTAVLRVPDLRVGDELEFTYTTPSSDPTMGSDSFGLLMLTPSPSPGRFHMGLSWDAGQKPEVRITPEIAGDAKRTADGVDIRIDNPPIVTPPKDAPPRYAWQRIVQYSDFASWAAASARITPLFAKAEILADDSPLKAEAKQIAAENSGKFDRMQAALKLVQQQVRYIYVGLNGGNFTPASADETWDRRYGDCKGKSVLLVALLRELGIPAEAVLANASGGDDGLDQRLPNPALFDHVVVRATVDGKRYWLDGTLPAVATADTKPAIPFRWVLPLTGAKASLEQLPWKPSDRPDEINLFEYDARAGFDEPAKITTTSIKRGIEGIAEYAQLSAATHDQLLQSLRSNLTGGSMWNSVDSVDYRYDAGTRASVLTITGTGPVDWDVESGGGRSLTLPGGGFNPPERRQRASDQDQDAPFYNKPEYSCYVTTVRLPNDTKPGNWAYNSVFDNLIYGRIFYRDFEKTDGSITMVRGSRIEQTEIDRAQAERDNRQLDSFDNSKAWISYTPGAQFPRISHFGSVPTTYDGDWLHSDELCLPKDLRPSMQ